MNKRSTKFYRKNEEEVMKKLGFEPTINSGAGWIEKEDGQSEYCICQLKSTDKFSMSIKQKDLSVLEYNASVAHKLPVFAIQFLNTGVTWVMIKPDDLEHIQGVLKSNYQSKESSETIEISIDNKVEEEYTNSKVSKKAINKSYLARQRYLKQEQAEREEQEIFYKKKQKERRTSIGKKV